MQRGTLVLTVVAGALVFLVVLGLYLPASWFSSALPPQVRCAELGGSVWSGECLGLRFQDAPLGDATWNLAALAALRGHFTGNAEVRGSALSGHADLDLSFAGTGEMRNVNLRLVLDPALLPQMPRDQRGTVTAELKSLAISSGAPRAIDGTIELRDLRQVGARPMDLGSYQVTFDGSVDPDGSMVGKLRDLGGPFMVDGLITLTPPNAYLVEGYITGRSADAEGVVRDITLGAMPDASGRSKFSFEGSY